LVLTNYSKQHCFCHFFDEEWKTSVEEEGGSVRKQQFEEDESETSIHVWRGPKEDLRKDNME